LEDYTSIKAKYGGTENVFFGAACDPTQPERVAYIIGIDNSTQNIWIGAGTTFAQGVAISPALSASGVEGGQSQDFVNMSFGNNEWGIIARTNTPSLHPIFLTISSSGSSVTHNRDLTSINPPITHMRPGTTSIIYIQASAAQKYYRSTDNGATFTLIDVDIVNNPAYRGATIDDVGTQIMNRYSIGAKGRSNDGGFSYSNLPNLPPGNYFFEYAGGSGGSSKWIAAGGSVVRSTANFGETWPNKEGNITGIVAIPNINFVRALVIG
jgi:hypothetical protein